MTNAEIQVGEFVRTRRGIAKIKEIQTVQPRMNGKDDIIYKIDKPYIGLSLEDIINHDFDIIKLIETGDYVNSDEVSMITEIGGEKVVVCNDYDFDDSAIIYNNKRIKSIVTKEQFKAMEYEVGGEDV